MLEIEVKIRIEDPEGMTRKLLEQGAKLDKDRYFEENTLYDFPDRNLTKRHQALRLRKIKKKTYLAFKGSPEKSRKFKIREEYETEVKNIMQIKKIMKSLGLVPCFQYEKYRTVFRKKNLKVCLDETPVGDFLEIEGKQTQIVRFTQSLGFKKKNFIKKDYVALLTEQRKPE